MEDWEPLLVIPLIIAACLASFWLLYRYRARWSRRRLRQQVEAQLVEHLRSIGVRVEPRRVEDAEIRRREDEYAVRLRQLADARVWLRGIDSVEVWHKTKKAGRESVVEDEITYVASLEPGLNLDRIPILTSTVRLQTEGGETAFWWRGFEWGRLPLVADRLRVDQDLNRRLLRHFNTDTPGDLRIRAMPPDRVGISTSHDPEWMPSRELLECIEVISRHVNDYVAERNRERIEEDRHLRAQPAGACRAKRRPA